MKRIVLFLAFLWTLSAFAQDTLMTIGNRPIMKDEFIRIYKKNNSPSMGVKPLSVDEYLKLFIKFKLKVIEAENKGYDTTKAFLEEYNKYLRLLAENYFPDSTVLNKLLREAYQRSKVNVRLKYIVLNLPKNPTPDDTLKIYKKALQIRNRLMKEDFGKVAVETSDSRTVKRDSGDVWYQNVFSLPYKLENFAFEHKKGDISMPIQYNNAYFILKIVDKKPSMGKIHVAHIYVRLPMHPKEKDSLRAMDKIAKIKAALDSGLKFSNVARRYSDDMLTGKKGGDLGWIEPASPLLISFKKAAFSIKKPGDYIGPVRTEVGYHFIKLLERKTPGTFKQEKEKLLKRLKKDNRYKLAIQATVNKLKKQYNFKQLLDLDEITSKVSEDIFNGMWKADTFKNDKRPLISFDHKVYTVADFGMYLQKHQHLQQPRPIKPYIQEQFDNFITEKLKDYELPKLPDKIPQLRELKQEYHDGILLFNIMQDSISNKSIEDTAGLIKFFNENKLKYYQRLNLEIYSYSNRKGKKLALKYIKRGMPDSILLQKVHKKDTAFAIYKKAIFKKGDDKIADLIFQRYENGKIKPNKTIIVLPEQKKIVVIKDNFKYVRGYVLADYQTYLEDKWVQRLKKKYPVKINQKVLEEVKRELSQENLSENK